MVVFVGMAVVVMGGKDVGGVIMGMVWDEIDSGRGKENGEVVGLGE